METNVFTLKEAAKICGMTPRALYMHYYRGHIQPVKMKAHKLVFTSAQIDLFRMNYVVYDEKI